MSGHLITAVESGEDTGDCGRVVEVTVGGGGGGVFQKIESCR